MNALQRSGQADNTLVIFTPDHGELPGDHGLWIKGPLPLAEATKTCIKPLNNAIATEFEQGAG